MKLKDGFMLREIAGQWIVVPIGARVVEFNGIITLNETGAFIWKCLEEGKSKSDALESMLKEYDIDQATAQIDMEEFIESMKENNLFAEAE